MFIKKLQIKNFKSIKETNIDFAPLSMIVGANATGKSNLINVFRFIGNIATNGLDNAIALQGGIPYLANANLPKGEPIEIRFVLDLSEEPWVRSIKRNKISLSVQEIDYKFIIQPHLRGTGYRIAEDYLKINYICKKITSADENIEQNSEPVIYSTIFHRKTSKSSIQQTVEITPSTELDDLINSPNFDRTRTYFCEWANEDKNELMLYRISFILPPSFSESNFIRIFDFDPKELKKASSMASIKVLSEDGSNIASVLQNILRSKENRNKLTTLLNEFLPFINGISIENNLDKSFSYKVKEKYSNKAFHANFLSDGTVSILAIIIALYFEERSNIIILEEPERNIHPKLLSNLLSSAEDISREKQIIITTHNPEFLKHAKIKNVRLVSRDSQGYTQIKSPESSNVVKCFMQNDLGLDDLFLHDMLGE